MTFRFDKMTIKAQEAVQSAQGLAESRSHQQLLPLHVLAALLEDRFLRSLANGRGEMEWSAIALDQRDSAGLTV